MGVVSHLQYPSDRVFTLNAAPEHDLWSGLDKKEDFSLDLFSASNPLTSLGNFTDATGTILAFSYLNLADGDYFFRIGGPIGDAKFGNAYVYRFEVSEVPLPPALPLFATAPGGMLVFGDRRRKAPA
jgi:hypothetical protein